MATEYQLICHDCNEIINLGRLGDASDIIDYVLEDHKDHNIETSEDSDYKQDLYDAGYVVIFNTDRYHQNPKLENENDFLEFYNNNRRPD